MSKLKIKKGDLVIVNAGEDKGKQGRVLEVLKSKNRVIVEDVKIITKHAKPDAENPQGGIVKKEAAVHISNLMLVCPETGKATRVGRKLNDADKLVRYSKSSKNKQEIK